VGLLKDELTSQLADIKKLQMEMNDKLEDGPQRAIPHPAFHRLWARYIRAEKVSMESFFDYMQVSSSSCGSSRRLRRIRFVGIVNHKNTVRSH